jgi:hypothetical protein
MTSETDEQFLNSMEQWVTGSLVFKREHRDRLFTLARRGAALENHGQDAKLSEETTPAGEPRDRLRPDRRTNVAERLFGDE